VLLGTPEPGGGGLNEMDFDILNATYSRQSFNASIMQSSTNWSATLAQATEVRRASVCHTPAALTMLR
jgi:hypothetical protein